MTETQPDEVSVGAADEAAGEPLVCYRYLVEGRVQGVYFRGSAREQAVRLGVTGYARNLPDGRVEVLACGSREAVVQLHGWLRAGPPMARVSRVICEAQEYRPWSGFRVD